MRLAEAGVGLDENTVNEAAFLSKGVVSRPP